MQASEKHPKDEELLMAMDGELSPGRQTRVDVHLARCEPCRDRYSQLEKAAAELSDAYRCDADGGTSSIDGRSALESTLRDASKRREGSWAFPAAATAAAIVGGVLLSLLFGRGTQAPGVEAGALPVASLTPGATVSLSIDEICGGNVDGPDQIPLSMRQEVLRAYGMEGVSADEYELDYLITPELGGATDALNLWPQRYRARRWNAHVKDQLEDLLPRMVCAHQIDLETAQRDIAVDWIAAYRKYFRTSDPLSQQASVLNSRF